MIDQWAHKRLVSRRRATINYPSIEELSREFNELATARLFELTPLGPPFLSWPARVVREERHRGR